MAGNSTSGLQPAPRATMRPSALLLLAVLAASAQFKSTVPLVVSPVTVMDSSGRFINGLTAADLAVYDNNVPQKVQLQVVEAPVSLAVLIQVTPNAWTVLDKLGHSGVMFSDLLAAYQGETAIVRFSDDVRVVQDFTPDSAKLTKALKYMRPIGWGCALYDAVSETIHLLDQRDPKRRRILLVIAQTRDQDSKMKLDALLREPALQNTTIYWLTYSTFLTPFTTKTKTKWDRMTEEEKKKHEHVPKYDEGVPPDYVPGSLFNIFTSIANQAKVNAAALLSRSTGGRTWEFVKQKGLEDAIHAVAEEAHQQYILTFEPKPDEPGIFHALSAEVKGRPDLRVRTRTGYWSVR